MTNPATYVVKNINTNEALEGSPSTELIRESLSAYPTGAVLAYRDNGRVWQYVASRREATRAVLTVWVEIL